MDIHKKKTCVFFNKSAEFCSEQLGQGVGNRRSARKFTTKQLFGQVIALVKKLIIHLHFKHSRAFKTGGCMRALDKPLELVYCR